MTKREDFEARLFAAKALIRERDRRKELKEFARNPWRKGHNETDLCMCHDCMFNPGGDQ